MNTTISLAFLSADDVDAWTADDDCIIDADPIADSCAYRMWLESQNNDSDPVLPEGARDIDYLFGVKTWGI